MYGLWILVIICGIIGPLLLILAHFIEEMPRRYRKQLTYYWTSPHGYSDDYMFCGSERDRERLGNEAWEHYFAIYKKYQRWHTIDNYEIASPIFIIGAVLTSAAFILILCAIFVPMGAAREVAYWSEFAPMVENLISNSDSLQDVGITGKVVEYNSWLAEARSSQEVYKNFSSYYGIDLSSLEYIEIGQ